MKVATATRTGRLTAWVASLLMAGIFVAGCGSGDSSDSAVVEPPSPIGSGEAVESSAKATPERPQPPGGLEMPKGDVPTPAAEPADQKSGIEMPTDGPDPNR